MDLIDRVDAHIRCMTISFDGLWLSINQMDHYKIDRYIGLMHNSNIEWPLLNICGKKRSKKYHINLFHTQFVVLSQNIFFFDKIFNSMVLERKCSSAYFGTIFKKKLILSFWDGISRNFYTVTIKIRKKWYREHKQTFLKQCTNDNGNDGSNHNRRKSTVCHSLSINLHF